MKRHHLGLFFVCIAAAASASCSEGTDNSTCTDGAYKCVINTLNKCVDGQWQRAMKQRGVACQTARNNPQPPINAIQMAYVNA